MDANAYLAEREKQSTSVEKEIRAHGGCVYPALLTGSAKEEAYVARMVKRDRELARGRD